MNIKPGIKTSEFWLTLLTLVLSALAGLGVIGTTQADELQGILTPLVAAVLPVVVYVAGRAYVKSRSK
jgi:lipopolysaccharide export LptBFGC system permease protein LptF